MEPLLQPDARIFKPLNIPEKILMGPGPTNASKVVRDACSLPMLGPVDKELLQVMDDCKAGIQYLFQTENKYTFAVSGTGHAALECAIMNMVEVGDRILVAEHGVWGFRAADMVKRVGGIPIKITRPPGENFQLSDFEEGLKQNSAKMLFIAHSESSTGVIQPLEGLGDLCHKYNCLLLVDTVASIGGCPVYMDKQNIDILYSGSQKVLSCPPGPAPISFGSRAVESFRARKTPPVSFYFDFDHLTNYWGCTEDPVRYHHTGMMSNLYGFREGLRILAQEGLGNCWNRHLKCAELFHSTLETNGFELFVKNKSARLPTVTAIRIPKNVNFAEFKSHVLKNCNMDISGGLGPTAGLVFRVGLLGENCTTARVDMLANAMVKALKFCLKK
uniref:serine--pyruvate aminotransferase-like n=1 Tax=Styela clava TaxID=7725 RepID=UPI00193A2649|nr:serine--pyruvate aminotransferase-like [Styela clava]